VAKKLKIGYVTTSLSSIDGWGRYSKSLVEAVAPKAEVVVLTTAQTVNESEPNIFVKEVLPEPGFHPVVQLKVFWNAVKYFRGCDVVHSLVECYSPGLALASYLLGSKLIMTLHGTYSVPPAKLSIKKILMLIAYRRVSIATTGSKYTEQKVREIVNFGECRFIPNGVDDKIFYLLSETKNENYLITVGALKSRKGADLVIRAMTSLLTQFPNLKYKIIGASDDESYIKLLYDLIEQNQLSTRVELLGRVSDSDLRLLYNQASVFILAARDVSGNFEGFPMVFYEANACGIPVITTSGFGSEYAIKSGHNGLVIPPDRPEEIAKAVKQIITDPKIYQAYRNASLIEASNHTWSKIADQILEMYNDAIK